VALNVEKLETTAMAGWEPTTPEAGSVLSAAPSEFMRILPETAPLVAVAAIRTEMVVVATEPPLAVKVREEAKR
jgi:hypothetical protein